MASTVYKYSDVAIQGTSSLYDADCILQAIRTTMFTKKGERIFRPDVGSDLDNYLFTNMNDTTATAIKTAMKGIIAQQGSRVTLINLSVTPDYDNNCYEIYVQIALDGVISEDTILLKNKSAG